MHRHHVTPQRVVAALIACALAAVVPTYAQKGTSSKEQRNEEPKEDRQADKAKRAQTTVFGLHTLSSGQTLRLSVLNASLGQPPEPVTPGNDPPDPVHERRVTLAFDVYAQDPPEPGHEYAGDGSVRTLRLVRRESRTFLLQPGQAASFEIAGQAGEVIGAWTLGDPPDPISDPPEPVHESTRRGDDGAAEPPEPIRPVVMTSLEVRQDNTTRLVLPGVTRGFNPQPDPPRNHSSNE